jgi:hypothetical protein
LEREKNFVGDQKKRKEALRLIKSWLEELEENDQVKHKSNEVVDKSEEEEQEGKY